MSFSEFIKNNFAEISNNTKGSSISEKVRNNAFESFKNKDFPTSKTEDWKFTNVKPLVNTEYKIGDLSSNINIADYALPNFEGSQLVFINGVFNEAKSTIEKESGLEVQNLSSAINENKNGLESGFNSIVDESNIFSEINSSLYQDGAYITVAKNTVIEKPILLLFLIDSSNQNTVSFPRNFILVEENAQVKVIEKFNTIGTNKSLAASVTEIFVDQYANCEYYKIQTDVDTASHIGTTNVKQKAHSIFSDYTVSLSGDIVRNDINVTQDGEHGETNMIGLYFLSGNTHVDNHTALDLLSPHSYSNEIYKGILDDKSNAVFNGKIFVRTEAQKTNAFQQNNNIILSDDAKVNTKPQLEIWADDVKCSHGATTGQLDKEALFYLKARGIGEKSAKALLLNAFAADIVNKIKIQPIREYLESIIEKKLNA